MTAQQGLPEVVAEKKCVCGEPNIPGVVHRQDGPCYHKETGNAAYPALTRCEAELAALRSRLAESEKEAERLKEAEGISRLAVELSTPWEQAILKDATDIRAQLRATEQERDAFKEALWHYSNVVSEGGRMYARDALAATPYPTQNKLPDGYCHGPSQATPNKGEK